jgi:hypothetical protein
MLRRAPVGCSSTEDIVMTHTVTAGNDAISQFLACGSAVQIERISLFSLASAWRIVSASGSSPHRPIST